MDEDGFQMLSKHKYEPAYGPVMTLFQSERYRAAEVREEKKRQNAIFYEDAYSPAGNIIRRGS